jgi:hypothetical protein
LQSRQLVGFQLSSLKQFGLDEDVLLDRM